MNKWHQIANAFLIGQHLFQHPWSCFFANLLPKNVCKFTRSVHDQLMYTFDWSTSIISIHGNYRTYFCKHTAEQFGCSKLYWKFFKSLPLTTLFCPHLCYLMSFIHLMLCNYYIISVMIMLYYTHFSATGLQRNMTTDVEIDVDQSGMHINRSCTDPVK
jgi:hypothetical protein